MIGDIIDIFKARRDPALASSLAAKFAAGAAIERASWPLVIAKFWMSVALVICAVLIVGFAFSGAQLHWATALPALVPASIGYGILRIWRGINAGLDRVTDLAHRMTDRGIGHVQARRDTRDIT